MEHIEYFEIWCVYKNASCEHWDYVEEADTKREAVALMKKHYPNGKVMCCISVDKNLCGNEFGYGDTKSHALASLKKQLKPYGYIPYDPLSKNTNN